MAKRVVLELSSSTNFVYSLRRAIVLWLFFFSFAVNEIFV